ncbi:hypothetical protein AHF37_02338 [Paragonimus kellicotti]|nr:hypothetical protein AHF37_02338 [Paragonimus kellicotti]
MILANLKFIPGDLKCGNLLVKDDGIIQIADFGVAGFLASQPLTATDSVDLRRFTFVGTPCWMAPEVMQQARGYNQKADIWSLGITTIEMATGQAPYAKYAPMKVLMLTLQNDPPDIDTVATVSNQYADYGQKFRKFTRACLVKDPAQRLSARELLGHTYIKAKAKDRDLLCRVLLGGEIPPPVTRSNKHTEDRADKRDPKTKCTEWNFDTIGRGPQGAPDSDDSDEPDYGSGLALSDPDSGQHVPNQTVIAGSPSTDGTRAAAAAAAAAVSACGTSAFSGCGSLPPAPACTPVSPDGVVSGMVGAFADVMIDPNFAVGGSGQSANPEDGVRRSEPIIALLNRRAGVVPFVHRDASLTQRVTLLHSDWVAEFGQFGHVRDMLSQCGTCACASALANISSSHATACGHSADVLARELVEADLLDGCDLVLVAHNMSELISNPSARERVFPLNSPPAPGQVPVESELHGYAKVLIRVVGSSSL